jgi:hypothetical protein
LDIKHNGCVVALAAIAISWLTDMAMPALAQDAPNSSQLWRPKDASYRFADQITADSCGPESDFVFELRKNSVFGDSFNCRVTKLTDVTEGAIRLDLSCLEPQFDPDDNPAHVERHKEIMKLRKINDKSFFILMTNNGKFSTPEWLVRLWRPKAC